MYGFDERHCGDLNVLLEEYFEAVKRFSSAMQPSFLLLWKCNMHGILILLLLNKPLELSICEHEFKAPAEMLCLRPLLIFFLMAIGQQESQ